MHLDVNDADVREKAQLLTENLQVLALARAIGG